MFLSCWLKEPAVTPVACLSVLDVLAVNVSSGGSAHAQSTL